MFTHSLRTAVVLLALASVSGDRGHAQVVSERTGPDSTSSVSGTVEVHETGEPLPEASVSLAAGSKDGPGMGTRITDATGHFRFDRVPAGDYRLVVTFIGYHDLTDTLSVPAESDLSLDLKLSVSPITLEPLVVVTRRQNPLMEGFERRRAQSVGSFVTREQIEERHPIYVSQLLMTVPGVRVVPVSGWGYAVFLREGCRPVIWIDGVRIEHDNAVDQMLDPEDVEAIEVYRGAEVPIQFGPTPCGAVVFWTRMAKPGTDDGSIWKKALIAVAFATVAILVAH